MATAQRSGHYRKAFVMLFYMWYFCTRFFPFYLHKLFYDEGGDAEGTEVGGRVRFHRTQPEAFWSPEEPGLILEHGWGGGERGGVEVE